MKLEIAFTNDFAQACAYRDQGYEPIECAFGQNQSVLGRFSLDHHGKESFREGVAIRACRDLHGALKADPRFVVTGTPDADAVLAIIALADLVPKDCISPEFYRLVELNDVDPIGTDLLESREGVELAWFNQREGLYQNEAGFREAIALMTKLLTEGLTSEERDHVCKADAARRRNALEGMLSLRGKDGAELPLPKTLDAPLYRGPDFLKREGRVLVVKSAVWGFDVWYRAAPCVVSYASRMAKITIGCCNEEVACALFGEGGLSNVWPHFGGAWGGRETIGGSPRGVRMKLSDAHQTAGILVNCLIS